MDVAGSVVSILVSIIFGILGIYFSKILIASRSSYQLDWFLTARNSQSWWGIAMAFLAASIGSWCFFPYFPYDRQVDFNSQLVLLFLFAIAASYPILLIAYVGDIMKKKYPKIRSLADYAGQRFGRPVANYVSCVCIFNSGIGLLAEYSILGKLLSLFSDSHILPVVCISLSSLIFITFGGLPVSIWINRYQITLSIILILIIIAYVSSIIDLKLLQGTSGGTNFGSNGISTIIAMLISYQSGFVFADCMWQRVLASKNSEILKKGAWAGTILTMCFIFCIRLMGYLSFASGLVTDSRLSFVGIFINAPAWVVICFIVFGVCISQGFIGSFQHSLTASFMSLYSSFGFKDSLPFARATSILLHIPLILIGILRIEISNLFLMSNILTISCVLPILLGLVTPLEHYVNGSSVLLGSAFSLISVFVFGYASTGCFINGVFRVLFDVYSWEPFAIALITSVIGVALGAMIEIGLYACAGQPYIPDIKLHGHILPHHSYESMDSQDDTRSN